MANADKKKIINKIIGAVLSSLLFALCVLFAKNHVYKFIEISLWIAVGVLPILFLFSILKKNSALYKICILIAYFGAIVLLIYTAIKATGILDTILNVKSGKELYEILNAKYGNNLYIVLVIFQFLQVTFIPIASSIVTAAGYYLCGQNVWLTILFCSIGLWLGSFFAFYLGRVFGVKLVKWIAGEKMLIKYNKFVKGKDKIMLDYMFLFPVYPDDILCMIAGLTTMSWREFIFIQVLARPINVASTVLLLHFGTSLTAIFPLNTVWGILFWCVIVALFIASFILIWKKADKMEKGMTKLISKITGRPVITDINVIYKLKTYTEETQEENKEAENAEENAEAESPELREEALATQEESQKTEEVLQEINDTETEEIKEKSPEELQREAEEKEKEMIADTYKKVDKILDMNEKIVF